MNYKVWCKNNKEWEKGVTYLDSHGQLFKKGELSGILQYLSPSTHKIVRYAKQMEDSHKKTMKEFDVLYSQWQVGHPLDGVYNCSCVGIVLFDGNKFFIKDLDDNGEYDLDDYGGEGYLKIIGNLVENENFITEYFHGAYEGWDLNGAEEYLNNKSKVKVDTDFRMILGDE